METGVSKRSLPSTRRKHRTAQDLSAVAEQVEQLKRACSQLQEERAQLLQQHHLLSALADVLGHYRANLLDDDDDHEACMGQTAARLEELMLEQLMLQQLSIVQVPSQPLSRSSHSTDSSAGSNSSFSDNPYDLADFRSTCTSSSSLGDRVSTPLEPTDGAGAPAPPACWLSTSCRLSSCGCAVSCQAGSSSISLQQSFSAQLDEPAAPEHDPFMLTRHMVDQPANPSASHATLQSLQDNWAADIDQLRKCLHQLQTAHQSSTAHAAAAAESCSNAAAAGASYDPQGSWAPADLQQFPEGPDPVQAIKDVQMKMFTLCHSLAMVGKEGLFFELQLTNRHTGERLQEPCKARHRATLKELQLTPAQMQRMKAGYKFFQRLMSPLLVERRQLHAQGVQVAQPHQQPFFTHPSAAGCSVGTVSAAHSDQGARLQEQREQACKLRVLGKKDSFLRGAMALYMQGCLSWVQQAKLRVAMSPYHVQMGMFVVVLDEYMQEQQALQQA